MIKFLIGVLLFISSAFAYAGNKSCDSLFEEVKANLGQEHMSLKGQARLPFPGVALVFATALKDHVAVLIVTPLDLTGKWPKESNPKELGQCITPDGRAVNAYLDRPKLKTTEANMRT